MAFRIQDYDLELAKKLELQANLFLIKNKDKLSKKKQKDIKNKLDRTQYRDYIKSEWWKQRRDKYYKDNSKECFICHSKSNVSLHHANYHNLGNEKDEDLISLCWPCHKDYHRQYKTKKLIRNTGKFIGHKLLEIDEQRFAEAVARF